MPSLPAKMKILSILAKSGWKTEIKPSGSALFHKETRVSLKYFVNGCLWKHFFASNSPQTSSHSIFVTISVTLSHSTQFEFKIRAIKLQKNAKICLTL